MSIFARIFLLSFLSVSAVAGSFEDIKKDGNALFGDKKFAEAILVYNTAFEFADTDSNRAVIHSNLGQCFRGLGDTAQAIANFEQALVYDPNHIKALYWSIKLRLSDDISSDDQNTIRGLLATAHERHPREKHFRVLHAEFEMLLSGRCIAPGVSYLPNFLTDFEAQEIKRLLDQAQWAGRSKGSFSGRRMTSRDNAEFETMLGIITDKLIAHNFLPAGVKELGFAVVRYDQGGFLKQHKDHKDRVDHFVLGISIGGPCKLDFVLDSTHQKTSVALAPSSVFVTENEAHDSCTHGISDVEDRRYSLLFYVPTEKDRSNKFNIQTKKFVDSQETHRCDQCEVVSVIKLIAIFEMMGFSIH